MQTPDTTLVLLACATPTRFSDVRKTTGLGDARLRSALTSLRSAGLVSLSFSKKGATLLTRTPQGDTRAAALASSTSSPSTSVKEGEGSVHMVVYRAVEGAGRPLSAREVAAAIPLRVRLSVVASTLSFLVRFGLLAAHRQRQGIDRWRYTLPTDLPLPVLAPPVPAPPCASPRDRVDKEIVALLAREQRWMTSGEIQAITPVSWHRQRVSCRLRRLVEAGLIQFVRDPARASCHLFAILGLQPPPPPLASGLQTVKAPPSMRRVVELLLEEQRRKAVKDDSSCAPDRLVLDCPVPFENDGRGETRPAFAPQGTRSDKQQP